MTYQHDGNSNYSGNDDLELASKIFNNYNNWIAKTIANNINSNAKDILDFGAGTGTLVNLIKQKSSRTLNIDAVELDSDHQLLLKNRHINTYANISDLDKAYDVVYSSNVLEHIQDDLQIMRDIYKIIKPGGQFILSLPALNLLRTDWDDQIGHYRRYAKADLINKLNQAGFVVNTSKYMDSVGGILALVYKYKTKPKDHNPLISNSLALRFYDRVLIRFNLISDLLVNRFFGKSIFVVATKK